MESDGGTVRYALCISHDYQKILTAYERVYIGNDLDRIERGMVETIGEIEPGVDPAALSPGLTVTDWSGDDYRVVIAPEEREYDDKALRLQPRRYLERD